MDFECKWCGEDVTVHDGMDPSGWCDSCAHIIAAEAIHLVERLKASLHHMECCAACGMDTWDGCDGGNKALVAIADSEAFLSRSVGCPKSQPIDTNSKERTPHL